MEEKESKTAKNIPVSRNTGVLAKIKTPGRVSWKNFFGVFSKPSEGSVGPSQSSKSEDRSDNRRSNKKIKEKITNKVGFKNEPSSSNPPNDPLALKVTLPSNISNSDLSVSFEIESTEGKKHSKKKKKSKMYLTCVRKTEKLSEFEGQLILPPETDIDKLAKMPLYFVDTEGNPLKSDNDDYTVFQPVKNTLSKNVDIGMKIKDVHLKVKLEKFNLNDKPQKIPKYLSCSFVTASQCPPPNPNLIFDDAFDFYDDDDEVEEDEEEVSKDMQKKNISVKQEGVSSESSELIVSDILRNVMSTLPIKERCTQYNYKNPDYVPKKESVESVVPRSSCTTVNTLGYSEMTSYYVDSVPHNSPNERIIQTKVRHEPPCQGDDYYDHHKQLTEDELELLEHQRRVQELDRTLELLQNAKSKLACFLDPNDMKMVDPAKVYHILPVAGVPPVSYLCAPQSPGKLSLSVETSNPMEIVCTQGGINEDTEEKRNNPVQPTVHCISSSAETHGDIHLANAPSLLITKAQTKLEEELQKFREKDKSKSNIEFVPQHKYLRSISAASPKLKLNTIQNLYFSPKFSVEFDAAAYEGLSSLYEKRYGNRNNQSLASRENDIAYNIVENDIKSMIHDLLNETWNIKETVLENYGRDKKYRNDDDLVSLMEHELAERVSFTNSAFLADLKLGENDVQNEEIQVSRDETTSDFLTNISTVAIPYQVNYCMINKIQKSPMVTVNKLNAYHEIKTDEKGKLEISAGMINIFDEMYGFDSQRCKEVQFSADDNISDKKDSGTNETFESQYSKGYNVLVAEMPIDRAKTKFILNTAQIQQLGNEEDSIQDDDESSNDAHEPTPSEVSSITNKSGLKSIKFADINRTKNICETDTDFAETEINTVYSTSPEIMAISSFNSRSAYEPMLITQTIPKLQSSYNINDDETLIKETDLTKKNVSLPIMEVKDGVVSQPMVAEKKSITMSHLSQKSKYSAKSRSAYRPCISNSSTSLDYAITKSTQTITTLKKAVAIISDSDSEGIRIFQPNPVEDSDSHIPLQLKKSLEEIISIPGTSRSKNFEVDSYIASESQQSIMSEDYDADTDEGFTVSLPNLRYKHISKEELNTIEDIEKIERNIQQNEKLCESSGKIVIRSEVDYVLNMEESSSFMSTQSSILLTEEELEPKPITEKKVDSKVSLQ